MRRTPLQLKIPTEMRETLSADPWMGKCIIYDARCDGENEWQHAFTYAGKRRNEYWAILPMCNFHHRREASYRLEQYAAMVERIHHFAAEKDFRDKYPRSKLL